MPATRARRRALANAGMKGALYYDGRFRYDVESKLRWRDLTKPVVRKVRGCCI